MGDGRPNTSLEAALAEAEAGYRAANPESARLFEAAQRDLPGGDTRTTLYYSPFPLTWARGAGAWLWDVDGHQFTDFLADFTAGLYGHSDPVIAAAITKALGQGIVLGGPNRYQAPLAAAIRRRFPAMELLRFTNSGTEANLLALATARAATGRPAILVFHGAYHGSVLTFAGAGTLNLPYPTIRAPYNDADRTVELIERHAAELAAVIVEPVMGAGGCILAEREFLSALRTACDRHGVVLVFDEVMTSRLGWSGRQGALGIVPDLTSLGKYLGGGLSFGAFGGRAELMARFDPRQPEALGHGGTFNNNVLTMAAGLAGLERVLTPEALDILNARGDRMREALDALARRHGAPLQVTGIGSLIGLHWTGRPIRSPADLAADGPEAAARRAKLMALFHLDMLDRGQYLARRGLMALSLPITDTDVAGLLAAVDEFLATRRSLLPAG